VIAMAPVIIPAAVVAVTMVPMIVPRIRVPVAAPVAAITVIRPAKPETPSRIAVVRPAVTPTEAVIWPAPPEAGNQADAEIEGGREIVGWDRVPVVRNVIVFGRIVGNCLLVNRRQVACGNAAAIICIYDAVAGAIRRHVGRAAVNDRTK